MPIKFIDIIKNDIYENLKLSIPIFHNSTIEYNKNKISINTIKN